MQVVYLNSHLGLDARVGRVATSLEDPFSPTYDNNTRRSIAKNLFDLDPTFPVHSSFAVSEHVFRIMASYVCARWIEVDFALTYRVPFREFASSGDARARYPDCEERQDMLNVLRHIALDHPAKSEIQPYWELDAIRDSCIYASFDDWKWFGEREPSGLARQWSPKYSCKALQIFGIVRSSGYFVRGDIWAQIGKHFSTDLFWHKIAQ